MTVKVKKNKKGFTLAEILIVVAIIAVLAAIAIPLFVGAFDRAKEAVFNSNQSAIKSIGVAMLLSDGNVDFEANKTFYAYAIVDHGKIGTVMVISEEECAKQRMDIFCADTYEEWAEWYGDWESCVIMVMITIVDLEIAEHKGKLSTYSMPCAASAAV